MPQPLITRRIDAGLAKAVEQGLEVRAIYLSPSDYAALARLRTRRYRQTTGSSALVWPLSYGEHPIIGEKLVPVRQAKNQTVIYSTHGVAIHVPKKAPA